MSFNYPGFGTLVLDDTAALYQSDDEVINTGLVEIKRKTTPILKFDYTYWSSPVENQKLFDVSPNTLSDKYFSYDPVIRNWKEENPTNSMITGKGYIIRGPQNFSTTIATSFEAVFKGVPVNGKVSILLPPLSKNNLTGNPYPPAIDADAFILANASNVKGALYFWTHNTPITNNKYVSNDYAVYNLLGGVATRPALSSGVNETRPDGTIASGQAFFVITNGNGKIEFNNSMRVINKNSKFFKPGKAQKKGKEIPVERHRIWLNLESREGIFKQILVGYIQGVPNLDTSNYDAEPLGGNQFAEFYSLVEDKKRVIQGRILPFLQSDSISLGYKTTSNGDFSISIDHQDGIFINSDVL